MYSIPCSCGKVYKGKTCSPLKVRLEEKHFVKLRSKSRLWLIWLNDEIIKKASSQKFWPIISDWYGLSIIHQWKQLKRLNKKLMSHFTFLYRCWDLKLVSPVLTLKLLINSRRPQWIAKRVGHELVHDEYTITAGGNVNFSLNS